MRRDQLPPHKTATYVLPRHKVVYVSVPKAACTSLKWLIADLQGEDPERFHRSRSREVGRAMTIHRRDLWQHTPMLHQLPDEQLDAISSDDGWFVFAVVRHPSARLWAAWQSKFLLREPRWIDEFADEPWLPRVPKTTEDVADDFRRFVEALAADPTQPVMHDRHFMTQQQLVSPATTPYSRIYRTDEIPQLLDDLRAHNGDQHALTLQQSNESPLAPLASIFTPSMTEAIGGIYGADFEAFGYDDPVPANADTAGGYPRALLVAVGLLAERGERIGDLAVRAQWFADRKNELRDENKALRRENKALRGENEKLRAPSGGGSVVRRAYRRLSPPRVTSVDEQSIRSLAAGGRSRAELWASFVNATGAATVAEIGVYRGEFAARLLAECDGIATYYMIDPWRHLPDWNKPANKADDVYERYLTDAFEKTEAWADKRVVLRGRTTEVVDEIADGALDFAYVDGDHTLRGITIDLVKIFPKVRAGGWIGGDDFSPTIWQHSEQFEPTLVCPFAVHFAEAVGSRIYALPRKQFLIEKSAAGFEFVDLTGRYRDLALRSQLSRHVPAQSDRARVLARRVRRRLKRLTGAA